jgi:spermidine synthase
VDALRTLPLAEHLVSGEQRATAVMAFVTMFPTTLLLGVAFPIIMRLYAGDREPAATDRPPGSEDGADREGTDHRGVGRRLGRAYAANVGGAIAGAWAAGFVLIPLLGTHRSLNVLAAANVVVAAGLLRSAVRGMGAPLFRLLAPAGCALAIGAAALTPDLYGAIFARFGDRVLWYEEGLEQTVSILQGPEIRRMFLDGWHQADDSPSMLRLHALIGHLPLLLQPAPDPARRERAVLVIGLGGGATAGAAAAHDGALVDVVELSPSVVRGARFFAHVNGNAVDAPNVRVRFDDGRNHLLLAERKYDVVMADAIQPQHAGSASLYSVEYYRLARAALLDGGVMMQWIDAALPENQYRALLRTFLAAFPYVTAWSDGALVLGSERPYAIDPLAGRRLLAERLSGRARASLDSLGLTSPEAVLGLFTATDAELRAYAGDGPIVSDDHPYVEFFRSLPRDPNPPAASRFRRDPSALVRE